MCRRRVVWEVRAEEDVDGAMVVTVVVIVVSEVSSVEEGMVALVEKLQYGTSAGSEARCCHRSPVAVVEEVDVESEDVRGGALPPLHSGVLSNDGTAATASFEVLRRIVTTPGTCTLAVDDRCGVDWEDTDTDDINEPKAASWVTG